jgi:hypothetical protein
VPLHPVPRRQYLGSWVGLLEDSDDMIIIMITRISIIKTITIIVIMCPISVLGGVNGMLVMIKKQQY